MSPYFWVVPGVVVKVVDGDTLRADLDLGWNVSLRDKPIRLAHCNAPEKNTPEGVASMAETARLCPVGSSFMLTSHSLDKFGRVLGSVTLPDGRDLSKTLIAEGFAVPYEGGPRLDHPDED